jgi:hypothetical protein
LVAGDPLRLVHIRLDQARIDRECLASNQPGCNANCHHALKYPVSADCEPISFVRIGDQLSQWSPVGTRAGSRLGCAADLPRSLSNGIPHGENSIALITEHQMIVPVYIVKCPGELVERQLGLAAG